MSVETAEKVQNRPPVPVSVNSFNGVKLAAQEPWLYGVWYFGISVVLAFLSGFLWTPIAISQYGLQYVEPTQLQPGQWVLSGSGELFRSGAQVATFIGLFAWQLIAMIRTAYVGHSQHYLLQTIRFSGDEYLNVPFVVDNSNIQNWDDKMPGIPYHKSMVPVSIPQTLPYKYRFANLFIRNPKKKYKPYQPIDWELLIHPGTRAQTLERYNRGKAPFMGLLLNCPDTLPVGTTVYFAKQYGKAGKQILVAFVHDSPYSAENILKAASLTGYTSDQLAKLDEMLDHHVAMDKDYIIDQLEANLSREKIARIQEANRKDGEIADDQKWVRIGLDDKPTNAIPAKLLSLKGLVGMTLFTAACIGLYEAFKLGYFH